MYCGRGYVGHFYMTTMSFFFVCEATRRGNLLTKHQHVVLLNLKSLHKIHQHLQVFCDMCKQSTWNSDRGEDALRECNAKVHIDGVLDKLL